MPPWMEENAPREQPAEEIERLKMGALKDAEMSRGERQLVPASKVESVTGGEAVTWKRGLWRRLLTG